MSIPLFRPPDLSAAGVLVNQVLASGQIAGGPNVDRFEELLRGYLGHPWVTTTGDASTALTLALFQAGVRPGDEVLMSPLVCLATSCPVHNLFASIRWCDINPLTGNLDAAEVSRQVTGKTKAVVVSHWAGNPAEMDAIREAARRHRLAVVEDASEALGAEYHGRKIGATGSDFTVFSFYPNRHLTTIDGGAIACARREDFEALGRLKRYGIHRSSFRDPSGEIDPRSDIPVAGWNSYLNHVSATIGAEQMPGLPERVARHQVNGLHYDRRLAGVAGITLLQRPADSCSAYWVYTFLADRRDELLARLQEHGVQASKLHLRNDLYSCFATGARLPGVDRFFGHCLSVPCGWWVRETDRARVADIIEREAGLLARRGG